MMMHRDRAAGVYVHIPFCRSLCPYCDFCREKWTRSRVAGFVEALKTEISLRETPPFRELTYDSVYFGGGTPSILDPAHIEEFIRLLDSHFRISGDTEITLECNPESITTDKARAYRKAGINRISLGVQTFNDKHLLELGRIHDSTTAVRAFERLRQAGFHNINIDLIFGLSGQATDEWYADLEKAVELEPEHVSAYNLIIEPGTEYGRRYAAGHLSLPSDEEQKSMYDRVVARMANAGYCRYELSNFAKPGRQCRHNLKYWKRLPWLGLGPSAVLYDGEYRIRNPADLDNYVNHVSDGRLPDQEKEKIDREKALEETIMLGLRLADGISLVDLKQDFGYDLRDEKKEVLISLAENELIELTEHSIRLTPEALFLADEIIVKLI